MGLTQETVFDKIYARSCYQIICWQIFFFSRNIFFLTDRNKNMLWRTISMEKRTLFRSVCNRTYQKSLLVELLSSYLVRTDSRTDVRTCGVVVFVCPEIALDARLAREHDWGPRLARGTPEQHHDPVPERVEVDVAVVVRVRVEPDVAEHLEDSNKSTYHTRFGANLTAVNTTLYL